MSLSIIVSSAAAILSQHLGIGQWNQGNKKATARVASSFGSLENSEMRWKFHYPKYSDSFNCLNLNKFLGWLMGLEPTTTGITILDSTN
jgi:hypothetical protein